MGGRGSSSATRGRGVSVSSLGQAVTAAQQATAPPVTTAQQAQDLSQAIQQGAVPPATINDGDLSQADVNRLVANQNAYMATDPDADLARGMYISKNATATGYSMSQNLNYKLDNGMTLDGNESFMYQSLRGAMQTLGADATLYRGAHSDVTRALGLQSWDGMSESQIQSALVGKSWQSASFTSASYDQSKSPFLSGAQAGGREVVLRMHTSGQTRVMMGARSQTEVIADIGTHFQVTDAHYTGKTATPRGSGRLYRQIVLDVDVW